MPKQKKQPRKAVFFYMDERKKKLEREGRRFPGGLSEVFSSYFPEWEALSLEDKEKYEVMAKEEKEKDKANLDNKFTNSGESYAQAQVRNERKREKESKLNNLIEKLVCDNSNGRRPENRVYIFIKFLNYVEETQYSGEGLVCPAEIALAAFSLSSGLKAVHWTLVDPEKPPNAYAVDVRKSCIEYGIPKPGSQKFEEKYREYDKIFERIKTFTENWLQDYDDDEDLTVFCMRDEIEPARHALNWLIQHMKGQKEEAKKFWSNLEFCDVSKLMIKMAEYGKRVNPSYPSRLADYKLERFADEILNIGSYDYKREITCPHHRQGKAANKMVWCAKNVVMRRLFLIFQEFLPQYQIEKTNRHDIESLPKIAREFTNPRTSPPRSYGDEWTSHCGIEEHATKTWKSDEAPSSSSQFYPSPSTSEFSDGKHQAKVSNYWEDDLSDLNYF